MAVWATTGCAGGHSSVQAGQWGEQMMQGIEPQELERYRVHGRVRWYGSAAA